MTEETIIEILKHWAKELALAYVHKCPETQTLALSKIQFWSTQLTSCQSAT